MFINNEGILNLWFVLPLTTVDLSNLLTNPSEHMRQFEDNAQKL